ncbi:MAG: hypothetical protein ACJA0H_000410 [Francisellaceae bacterium]|jgi:hypothetical protein
MKQKTFKEPEVSKTLEGDLERFMKFMVGEINTRFINGTIKKLNKGTVEKFEQFADAQIGNYASIFIKLAKQSKRKILKQFTNKRIDLKIKEILNNANDYNKQQFYTQFEKSSGIDVKAIALKEGLKPSTNALMIETAEWVKRQRDEAMNFFNANVLRSMAHNGDLDVVLETAMANAHKFKNDAAFVARNQMAAFNSTLSNIRAQNLGVTEATWDATADISTKANRVRPSHADRDGKTYDIKKGLYSSIDQKYLQVGIDFNCFEGSVKVNNTAFCNILYRRNFNGVCSKITFSNNETFTCTPNHPILTDKGFKSAYLINNTDNIVRVTNKAINGVDFNHKNFIPSFDQIFSAFVLNGAVPSVSSHVAGKFHGDISDSEIEIIDINSLLMNKINPSILKKFNEFNLTKSDKMLVFKSLTCLGESNSGCNAFTHAPDGIVSKLNLVIPLILAHLTPLELFGFALGSWHDSITDDYFSNSLSGDIKTFGDCVFAFTALVHGADVVSKKLDLISSNHNGCFNSSLPAHNRELGCAKSEFIRSNSDERAANYFIDRIVDNINVDFSGHVYNLETVSGYYTASTTVVSNCRCKAKFIIPE